jgi:large-conductance mechanosensitive channel
MRAKDETAEPTEIELLTEIRDALQQRNSGSA